ncbi:MAG TPA: mechanosensitive ion channel family protein [Thermoanaerobaculia bacterium]|nr:mechanosensitive ion channel family protein [Thermoanaerobaculia bacterium]
MAETWSLIPEPLRSTFAVEVLGSTLWEWSLAAVTFLVALVFLQVLQRTLVRRLERFAAATETQVDDLLVELLQRTGTWFLVLGALYLASLPLDLEPGLRVGLKRLFALVLFVQIGIWASHLLTFLLERYLRRRGGEQAPRLAVLSLFAFFGQVLVWSVVFLLALDNFGFDVTTLIAGLGIGGIAIGLALQNVLQDTFASLSIILDKPFEEGDFLVVGDFAGTVERIGIKTTRVRSLSGEQLVFGNNDLLGSRIRNFKRLLERRILFTFGVVYQTPPEVLEWIARTVREIVEAQEQARFDRAHFKAFGDSALIFEVVYHVLVPEYNVYMDVQQQINLQLMRALAAEGVVFAYPTHTVYLRREEAAAPASPGGVVS